jgi:NAD(P)-dependent dehydrogenase (short-subunit alcohol dehydrogenase family)
MNICFENKVALVTGAGSGLGLATAKAFAQSGASVALADWNDEAARSAAEDLIEAIAGIRRAPVLKHAFKTSLGDMR